MTLHIYFGSTVIGPHLGAKLGGGVKGEYQDRVFEASLETSSGSENQKIEPRDLSEVTRSLRLGTPIVQQDRSGPRAFDTMSETPHLGDYIMSCWQLNMAA